MAEGWRVRKGGEWGSGGGCLTFGSGAVEGSRVKNVDDESAVVVVVVC